MNGFRLRRGRERERDRVRKKERERENATEFSEKKTDVSKKTLTAFFSVQSFLCV